ncbi:hypothetical protein G5V59_03090 [Nocardioides sp. W3-2-3]|nr:hypothetical protein [Nocardioides convexus]
MRTWEKETRSRRRLGLLALPWVGALVLGGAPATPAASSSTRRRGRSTAAATA